MRIHIGGAEITMLNPILAKRKLSLPLSTAPARTPSPSSPDKFSSRSAWSVFCIPTPQRNHPAWNTRSPTPGMAASAAIRKTPHGQTPPCPSHIHLFPYRAGRSRPRPRAESQHSCMMFGGFAGVRGFRGFGGFGGFRGFRGVRGFGGRTARCSS